MTHHHQSPGYCEVVDIEYFTLERLTVIQKIEDNTTRMCIKELYTLLIKLEFSKTYSMMFPQQVESRTIISLNKVKSFKLSSRVGIL